MQVKLDMIGIIVRDMPASLAFYRALGWQIPPEKDDEPHVEHTLSNGLRIGWDTYAVVHSFSPDWQPPTGGGHRIALAFLCDTPAEVDTCFNRLADLGYKAHKSPFDAPWGQRYAMIEDPDGNVIDLFAPLVTA